MWGSIYSYGVFFKPVSEEFGWTRAMTSGAYSLYMVLHGALYIVTGRLVDRFGPKMVMTACGLLLGAGFLLMSLIDSLWQLYLFYGVLIGIGISGGVVPVLSMVARWFTRRRELATGLAASGIGVGTMALPPVAGWLITTHGWRVSYLITGITILVVITVLAQFLKRDPTQIGQQPYGEGGLKTHPDFALQAKGTHFREAIRSRQFWLVCSIAAFFGFTVHTSMVHIVPHATDIGISPEVAAGILTAIGAASIAGRVGMGAAAARIGKKPSFIIIAALMLTAYLVVIPAREMWQFYLFAALFGIAQGGMDSILSPIVAELFGLASHGTLFGVACFISTVGGAVGPLLAGYIFDVAGSYYIAFWVFAAVCVLGVVLTTLFKPVRRESLVENDRSI